MAFKNRSGIKDIKINFDLMPLMSVLDSVPTFFFTPQVKKELYEGVARIAKKNLQTSNFNNNMIEESTKYIRNWRGNRENPPLIETGKLLNSIKAVKDGVEMEDYGQYHIDGYKIRSNKFTKAWNIKAGTRVPKRNFLKSQKGSAMSAKISEKAKKEMITKINKTIRTKLKSMRR